MKRFSIYSNHNVFAKIQKWEIEDQINDLSNQWDNETDTHKRNNILMKMNELSAKLETLEAI